MKDEIYCIKMIFKGRVKTQEIVLRTKKYPGMKANTCNPSTWKANGGGLKSSGPHWVIWGKLSLCACVRMLPPTLRYIRVRISKVPHYFVSPWDCLLLCSPGWTQLQTSSCFSILSAWSTGVSHPPGFSSILFWHDYVPKNLDTFISNILLSSKT